MSKQKVYDEIEEVVSDDLPKNIRLATLYRILQAVEETDGFGVDEEKQDLKDFINSKIKEVNDGD